ncbi:beta-eliminating lyase [Xylaria palmicola]|nr:beta-eliminating lyase [Xylaria palmicola]
MSYVPWSLEEPLVRPPTHQALVVRSIPQTTQEERKRILEDVQYNIFNFPAGLVTCDYLSDSGTSAMTDVQWAALMRGDESYGRNWGYYCLLEAFRDVFERGESRQHAFRHILTGTANVEFYQNVLMKPHEGGFVNGGVHQLNKPNFFVVPQGRCAEYLLFSTVKEMVKDGPQGKISGQLTIVSNGFFDTTGANAAAAGFALETFTQPGLTDPFPEELVGRQNNFKGNLDVAATETFLNEHPGQVPLIVLTITNNWAAAQPVSMANIRAAAELARRKSIPLFFDACRFAENAVFIKFFEAGYSDKLIAEIVQEMFTYADGFTISLKKDGLSSMGGVLCFRDKGLFAQRYEGIGHRIKQRQILSYGNDSYGGMSGRDIMMVVVGLYEVIKESYLRKRAFQVRAFAQKLLANNLPVLLPPGGHAIYLDMNKFFFGSDREPGDFASVGFTIEILKEYGIRVFEAGPFSWQWDRASPDERKKIPNLVRFAVPRQVFSDEHIDYTVAAIKKLHDCRHAIPNVRIIRGKDMSLRHFSCGMELVPVDPSIRGTWYSEASGQVSRLSQAIGQEEVPRTQLLDALRLATGDWGQETVPNTLDPARWASSLGKDHSPFQYAVWLDQETGGAELRVMLEAQPEGASLTSLQESALKLNEAIKMNGDGAVSLDQFELIRDLFMPENPEGKFALRHDYAATGTGLDWKIYFDPSASGQHNVLSTTRRAFERLGLASEWALVEGTMTPSDSVMYFGLDLSAGPGNPGVEVHIYHSAATAAAIARRHEAVCTQASGWEIQRFCEIMTGGSAGPYTGHPVASSFTFSGRAGVGAVHFPVAEYAGDDGEVQRRVEQYMLARSVPASFQRRYRKSISAVQRRPLTAGPGLHSWVGLRQSASGALSNVFWLSAELLAGAK